MDECMGKNGYSKLCVRNLSVVRWHCFKLDACCISKDKISVLFFIGFSRIF